MTKRASLRPAQDAEDARFELARVASDTLSESEAQRSNASLSERLRAAAEVRGTGGYDDLELHLDQRSVSAQTAPAESVEPGR